MSRAWIALFLSTILASCPREGQSVLSEGASAGAAAPSTGGIHATPREAITATTSAPESPQAPAALSADKDGDGVADADDQCPYEPKTEHSTAPDNGCPHYVRLIPGQITLLSPILFDIAKASIRADSLPILDEVAATLRLHPELVIEVQGHGEEDPHRSLSITQRRAESVRAALIVRGNVGPARITAKGYGATKPLASASTDEGRRINRRIEIHIIAPAPPP